MAVVQSLMVGFVLLCLWRSLRAVRMRRLVDDTPTSKVKGVFIGLVEVNGVVEVEAPLLSHLAEVECVHYRWSVQEKWERIVTRTSNDSQGRTHTTSTVESGWTTVEAGQANCPFILKDDSGSILIHPEGAELHETSVLSEECDSTAPLFFEKGPSALVANSKGIRRFEEHAILVGQPVYVLGRARERDDVVAPEIRKDELEKNFVISTSGEKGVSSALRFASWGWAFLGLGFSSVIVWVWGVNGEGSGSVSPSLYIFAWVLFGFVWFGLWTWMVFNSLTTLRRRVEQARSTVEVNLARRADLIPKLVEIVKASNEHEARVLEMLAKIRTDLEQKTSGKYDLSALVEAFPKISTVDSFVALQKEITDTEDRIALARAYHLEIASFLSARLQVYPDRIVSGWLPRLMD